MNTQIHLLRGAATAALLSACSTGFAVTLIDLGGGVQPQAINNLGEIVGTTGLQRRAFLYSNGTMQFLDTLSGTVGESFALGINDSGQITGGAQFLYGPTRPFLYSNGKMIDLGTFRGEDISGGGYGINNAGQVTGIARTAAGGEHAFLYSNGTMTDLGTLDNTPGASSGGGDINNLGQIIGSSQTADGTFHPFLYSNGKMSDLGNLGTDNGFSIFNPNAINDAGQIAGYARRANGEDTGFLYSDGKLIDLGKLRSDFTPVFVQGINNAGRVTGTSFISRANYNYHAFLYNGTMIDLNTLLPTTDSPFILESATDINDLGQIVGEGFFALGDHERHGYLLSDLPISVIPIPTPWVMLLSGLIAVGAAGVFTRRRSGDDNMNAAINAA